MSEAMKKAEIRQRIKTLKKSVGEDVANIAATKVFAQVEKCAEFQKAKHVLVYHSLPDELSTHAFIEKWHGLKKLYLPRVNGDLLEILPYDSARLQSGAFNIEEPTGDEIIDACDIDLIIVPGIAFDCNGSRVGRGKGYYDRLLCETTAIKIGVGYDFQLLEEYIEAEEHDVKVDAVITEHRCIYITEN